MRCCHNHEGGVAPSLLFFFLILVMIFCRQGAGGWVEECCESTSVCEC